MTRKLVSGVLAAVLAAALSIAVALPAFADSHDHREVFLIAPTVDEFCSWFEELFDDLDEWDDEDWEDFNDTGLFEQFEQRPIDDFAELVSELDALLERHEDADEVNLIFDEHELFIIVTPSLDRCEGFEELAELFDLGLEPGAYIWAPTVEEFCAFFEDIFDEFDDFDEEDWEDFDFEEFENGELNGMVEDFLDDDFFEPEPLTGDDLAALEGLIAELDALLADAPDADTLFAYYDGEVLVIEMTPDIFECDLPDEFFDDAPIDGVPAGAGGMAGGPPSAAPIALLGALLLAMVGGLALAVRRPAA